MKKNILIALSSSCTALALVLLMVFRNVNVNITTFIMCLVFVEIFCVTGLLFFDSD